MFFQSINTMMAAGTDLSIHIRRVGEQLVVSTLPRNNNLKDEAQSYLTPLTVTGTPMELDAGFLQAILQPIQKAGGLLINLEQFEKQAAATASKAKTEKPKADNETNDAREKRENYDKCLKKADELAAAKRYSEALTYLKQAKTYATPMQQADLAKKTKLLEQEVAQGSLFGMEEATETKPVPQQPPVQQQIMQPMRQPQQLTQPVQQQPMQQSVPAQHTVPMQQPEQGAFQQPQPGYYQPSAPQPMHQPQPQSQPMQQPVILPPNSLYQPMDNHYLNALSKDPPSCSSNPSCNPPTIRHLGMKERKMPITPSSVRTRMPAIPISHRNTGCATRHN